MYKFLFFVSALILISCNVKESEPTKKLPNIVHIFTDDLGYGDIGCFGAKDIKTPNIDRMAEQGMKFTSFYSASAVCSPSRAGLLTGRLPQRMGIEEVFFPESFTGMPSEEITIAEMLKKKNYKTGMVGKWHLGHMTKFLPLQQGFDSYFGIPYSNDMASVVYLRGNEVESFEVDQTQTTKKYTEEALDFIESNKEESFFLYLAHNMPHVPIYASDEFLGTSERGLYGDVIQELDWSVGQILQKIEELNLSDNTLVIFSSDNGPWLVMEDHGGSSGGLREGKMFTFDGGMRVPTVAMWPGRIAPGSEYHSVASQMDWFPTFANLIGEELSSDIAIDGKDLSSVLFGDGKREDDTYLFFEGSDLQCYRSGNWKVKLPYSGFKGTRWKHTVAAHDTLLFDMSIDPNEQNNIFAYNRPMALSLIAEMKMKYKDLGELPPSLIVAGTANESHFDYLQDKKGY